MIKACDQALDQKDEEIKLSDLAIKQLKESNGKLNDDLEKEKEKEGSLLRNPILWGVIGLVIGAFAAGGSK